MIKVTDKYYITANTNCYTLQEKGIVQDENSKNYKQEVFKDRILYFIRKLLKRNCESKYKGVYK
jgi:hypothetical protein